MLVILFDGLLFSEHNLILIRAANSSLRFLLRNLAHILGAPIDVLSIFLQKWFLDHDLTRRCYLSQLSWEVQGSSFSGNVISWSLFYVTRQGRSNWHLVSGIIKIHFKMNNFPWIILTHSEYERLQLKYLVQQRCFKQLFPIVFFFSPTAYLVNISLLGWVHEYLLSAHLVFMVMVTESIIK